MYFRKFTSFISGLHFDLHFGFACLFVVEQSETRNKKKESPLVLFYTIVFCGEKKILLRPPPSTENSSHTHLQMRRCVNNANPAYYDHIVHCCRSNRGSVYPHSAAMQCCSRYVHGAAARRPPLASSSSSALANDPQQRLHQVGATLPPNMKKSRNHPLPTSYLRKKSHLHRLKVFFLLSKNTELYCSRCSHSNKRLFKTFCENLKQSERDWKHCKRQLTAVYRRW